MGHHAPLTTPEPGLCRCPRVSPARCCWDWLSCSWCSTFECPAHCIASSRGSAPPSPWAIGSVCGLFPGLAVLFLIYGGELVGSIPFGAIFGILLISALFMLKRFWLGLRITAVPIAATIKALLLEPSPDQALTTPELRPSATV